MTVWSDCVNCARFGISMLGLSTFLLHTPPFHWLIDAIFAGLHVAMRAVHVVLAVARITRMLFATLGHSLASLGSGRSALFAVALPALKPHFRRRQPKEPESAGRTMPLRLALLAGVGSLGAANLEAEAGIAPFAVAIAAIPILCAAAWAIRQLVKERAD